MIEQNTASAARLKIREPAAIRSPKTSSAKVIVEMPLGPNQDMKVRVAVSVAVPVSAAKTATGRATKNVTATIPTAAQPSPNRPWIVSTDPNTTNIPSLTISTRSSDWWEKWARRSGRRMPSVIAVTYTAMSPFPCGGSVAIP